MNRLLDAIAELVTERRGLVLGVIGLVALATAVWIPGIVADPRPQQLTASSLEQQAQIAESFRQRFGNPDHVIVLLVSAEDVLDPEPLGYAHQLGVEFQGRAYVDRIESVTFTPLAVPVADDDAHLDEGGLDDLDEPEGLDDLDDLDDGTSEGVTPGQDLDPELEDALGVLAQTAPERFPYGLLTIGNRLSAWRYGPTVEGDTVEPEEREQLISALENAPLVEGSLISQDRSLLAVALILDGRVEDHNVMQDSVRDVDAWLAGHPPPDGVQVIAGGLPHLFDSIVVKMEHDNFRIVPMTLAVCLLLLYLSFRWWPGMILPVCAVGITALMVVGTMAFVHEPMNVVNNIIPPLLIIIGVSDSIHLIGRYREELEHSATKLEAARNTVRAMTVACFLTSITTSVGLASLLASQTEMLQRFGVIASIGVMIAYFVTIGFLPAAMTGFAPPLPPRRRTAKGAPLTADRGPLEKGIVWLTAHILRRPWRFIVGATLLLALFSWGASQIDVDSSLLDEFDESDEAYRSTRLMDERLDGVRPLEVMLESETPGAFADPELLAAIDETQRWVREREGVSSSVAVTDYLRESWVRISDAPEGSVNEDFRSRAQVEALMVLFAQLERDPTSAFITTDRSVARIQVRMEDIGAKASNEIIDALRERLERQFGPHDITVSMTGEGYTGSVGLAAIVNDLLGSLTTAVAIIFLLLVFLFGSFRLGLLSIPPNVIPLVGTMAWMSLRGIPLNAATVIVFSISLGLAVDGSIHLLARFREEIESGIGRNASLLRAARGTGRAVVVSGITLMLGFGVMYFSSFVPVRRFGELIGVTVGMCLLSTLIVQPALLRVAAPKVAPKRFGRRKTPAKPLAATPAKPTPTPSTEEE